MKIKLCGVIIVLLVIYLLFSTNLYAGDETARPFGFVQSFKEIPVYISAVRTDGSTVVIEVGPYEGAVLPANTQEITAIPASFTPGEKDVIVVIGYYHGAAEAKFIKAIEKPGETRKLPRPTGAIATDFQVPERIKELIIPREAYLPGRSPEDIKMREREKEKVAQAEQREIDEHGDSFLKKLNEEYMRYKNRLGEIDTDSEEAKAIRDALPKLEEMINDRIEREKKRYGADWLERYRDPVTGELPGGILSYEKVLYKPVAPREPGVITGRVYTRKRGDEDTWTVQRMFTQGPAMTLGPFLEWPVHLEKAAKFNVIWHVTFCELADKKLFAKLKKLIETRVAINERLLKDNRKVSKQEFKDCKELIKIKPKVLAASKWKSGSLRGWKTTSDANGKFSFKLDFPGKENVIFLIVNVAPVPLLDHPQNAYIENQTPVVATAEFPLVWPRGRFIPESEIPANLLRVYPGGMMDSTAHEKKLREKKKQLRAAEKELDKLKKADKRPPGLEPKWQDRALKDQRALRERYVKKHGDSKKWTPELSKKFEKELAEVPDRSRSEWLKEAAEYAGKKQDTIGKVQRKVDLLKIAIKNLEGGIEERYKKIKLWDQKVIEAIGDLSIVVPEDYPDSPPHRFELGGEVSGGRMTPEVRQGYNTKVYLVKQVIDGNIRKRPVIGKYSGTGEYSVYYNPGVSGSPRPPFIFKFDEPIKKHLVINDFINTYRGSNGVGIVTVQSLFDGLTMPDMINGRLQQLFVPLPRTVEVEGYPIPNSRDFHAKVDKALEDYRSLTEKASQEVSKLMQDRKAGKFTREQANQQYMRINQKWSKEIREVMARLNDITKVNPAFK